MIPHAIIFYIQKGHMPILVKSYHFRGQSEYGSNHLFNYKWDLTFLLLKKCSYVDHVMDSREKMIENLKCCHNLLTWFYKGRKFTNWKVEDKKFYSTGSEECFKQFFPYIFMNWMKDPRKLWWCAKSWHKQ